MVPHHVWVVALVAVVTVGVVVADYEHTCTYTDLMARPRGVCGTQLSALMDVLCRVYHGKRSAGMRQPEPRVSRRAAASPAVFVPRQQAVAILQRGRRDGAVPGIVCECCIHNCGFTELKQYCAEPHTLKRAAGLLAWPRGRGDGVATGGGAGTQVRQESGAVIGDAPVEQSAVDTLPGDGAI